MCMGHALSLGPEYQVAGYFNLTTGRVLTLISIEYFAN